MLGCDRRHTLHRQSTLLPVKGLKTAADTGCMMISNDQARLAAEHLKSGVRCAVTPGACDVSAEVIREAIERASHAPDLREERLSEAKARMDGGAPDAHDVASKMISRIVSDSLR